MVPGGYSPTSNGWPLKLENALWKIRSRLGKSTVPPTGMATTCGWNVLVLLLHLDAPAGGWRAAARSTGSSHSTTPA